MLDYAHQEGHQDLVDLALKVRRTGHCGVVGGTDCHVVAGVWWWCLSFQVMEWSFQRGWDTEHGGILYFLDVEGHSPVQLEWNMKLWWPHCEALIAFAYAFRVTKE